MSSAVARATGAPVVAIYELSIWLRAQGPEERRRDGNRRHRSAVAGLEISMTPAVHTSSVVENDSDRLSGRAGGLRRAHGRPAGVLLCRRHRALRRHAAHSPSCMRRRSRFCQSAITTRWIRTRPPARANARRPAGGADALRHVPVADRDARTPKKLVDPGVDVLVLKPGETGQ